MEMIRWGLYEVDEPSGRWIENSGAHGSINSDVALLSRVRNSPPTLSGPLLVALIYYLGAQAAFYIGTLSDQIFALFWPPNVVLFCALLIVPQRRWWLYIAAAFPAHLIAEFGVGMPVTQALVAFATNCMVALLNAYGVHRFVGGPPWFGTFRKAFIYIVITAGISPAVSALGGAFVPILGGGSISDYWVFWSHWYLANALPNLTLGPVFLIWFSHGARWWPWRLSRRQIEPAMLAAALILTCIVVAEAGSRIVPASLLPALLLSPLPLVLWAAARYGEKGASGAVLVVSVVLTWRMLNGPGLFPGESPERGVLALQLFLTGLSIPVLLLGALIDELRRAEQTTLELAASIRTVSYLLHRPLLDKAGLGLALRYFAEGFMKRSGISINLEISPEVERLPPETELVLFQLVQEALTRISRHSQSPAARISLRRESASNGEHVVLTIEDFGKSIGDAHAATGHRDGSYPTQSVGLTSIRDRLHQIGGRLEIFSAVGGNTLKGVVPIRD
jgi:integral membrane sensor domain MASE1